MFKNRDRSDRPTLGAGKPIPTAAPLKGYSLQKPGFKICRPTRMSSAASAVHRTLGFWEPSATVGRRRRPEPSQISSRCQTLFSTFFEGLENTDPTIRNQLAAVVFPEGISNRRKPASHPKTETELRGGSRFIRFRFLGSVSNQSAASGALT